MWSYFLELFYLVIYKFIKNSQLINVSQFYWMINFHYAWMHIHWKHFCSPSGKPREIMAKVSLRLANLMKSFVQWSIVCNCDISVFLSTSGVAFLFIWALNSFQRSDYLKEKYSDFLSVKAYISVLFLQYFIFFSSIAFLLWRSPRPLCPVSGSIPLQGYFQSQM